MDDIWNTLQDKLFYSCSTNDLGDTMNNQSELHSSPWNSENNNSKKSSQNVNAFVKLKLFKGGGTRSEAWKRDKA